MVIERFRQGPGPVRERFQRQGRMIPENVSYVDSWMAASGQSCYQIMEAPNAEALAPWIECWSDIVDFEIVPVKTSLEYWAEKPLTGE